MECQPNHPQSNLFQSNVIRLALFHIVHKSISNSAEFMKELSWFSQLGLQHHLLRICNDFLSSSNKRGAISFHYESSSGGMRDDRAFRCWRCAARVRGVACLCPQSSDYLSFHFVWRARQALVRVFTLNIEESSATRVRLNLNQYNQNDKKDYPKPGVSTSQNTHLTRPLSSE